MSRANEMKSPGPCIAVLLAFMTGMPVPSAAAAEADAKLETCAAERDDQRRLACYDAEVARLKSEAAVETAAGEPGHGRPTTREGSRLPARQPDAAVDDFGMTPALARSKDKEEASEERKTLTAVVVRIDEKPYGERILYLDNGQVWEENSRNRNLPLAVGDEITVKSAAFGSYKLVGPGGKRFTRVKRTG